MIVLIVFAILINQHNPINMEKKYPIGGYAPGNYQRHCGTCGGGFFGDKRSFQCEPCALNDKAKFDALSPSEQEELVKRNVELLNVMMDASKNKQHNWEGVKATIQKANLRMEAARENARKVTHNAELQLYVAQGYYNAMSEIAAGREESDAVELLTWLNENGWMPADNGTWYNFITQQYEYPASQLYQLFKQRSAGSGEKGGTNE